MLQQPPWIVATVVVVVTVSLSVLGLIGFRKLVRSERFESANDVTAQTVALAGALLSFVLYLIFALEHPFVGELSVQTDPYEHVLETWREG